MFTVYVNRPTRRVSIHKATCNQPRKNGGVSSKEPPTGYYLDGLETFKAAQRVATDTGYDEVKLCSYCGPG